MNIGKLGDSGEFLKVLMGCLKNIIFIVDDEVVVNDFNTSFVQAFKLNPGEIIGRRCGEVLGCSYTVDEGRDCGKTSGCSNCKVREGFVKTISRDAEVEKKLVTLKLYINGVLEEKHFFFTTRLVKYEGRDTVMAVLDDVTELEESKRRALELAAIDPLTGINNRRSILKVLEKNFEEARRYGKKFSVVMADIDNFKNINDELGHQAGDRVIINTAEVINSELRRVDSSGRYGGEEFLIVLPSTLLKGAYLCAERIRKRVEGMETESGDRVTVSLGAAEYREGASLDGLIRDVDMLLYKAKRNGKNRVEI